MAGIRTRLWCDSDRYERCWDRVHRHGRYRHKRFPVVRRGQPVEDRRIPCEVYSRIVGYLRPVQNWNKGKAQEFEDRVNYDIPLLED